MPGERWQRVSNQRDELATERLAAKKEGKIRKEQTDRKIIRCLVTGPTQHGKAREKNSLPKQIVENRQGGTVCLGCQLRPVTAAQQPNGRLRLVAAQAFIDQLTNAQVVMTQDAQLQAHQDCWAVHGHEQQPITAKIIGAGRRRPHLTGDWHI